MVAVDICNLALSYLGDSATVASIDPPEGSAQAQHCARFYPMALNLMLEMHQWNFITTRAYLALVAGCIFERWRFVYAVPAAANSVISVLPKALYPRDAFQLAIANYLGHLPFEWERENGRDPRRDFQIETYNGQQVILSNACDAIARFTMTTVTPGMFPALFTDALAWKLASMLAGPLLKGEEGAAESKRCLEMFAPIAEQAKSQDANQQHDAPRPVPIWIGDR